MDSIKKLNKVSLTSVNREPTRSPKFPKEDDQNYSLAQLCLYCSLPINHVISVAVGCPRTLIRKKYTDKKTILHRLCILIFRANIYIVVTQLSNKLISFLILYYKHYAYQRA